ncbi:MAG: hypothetical protein ACE147_00695 [Candidatus Methylomirabilales bacterium]
MRLADAFRAAMGTARNRLASTEHPLTGVRHVTWEVIQAALAENRYQVRDTALPVCGLRTYRAGDRVPVGWVDGAPRFILGHLWRKAAFAPVRRLVAVGIVEELLVGDLDGQGADVWYRTHDRAERLEVRGLLRGAIPTAVKWGHDGCSFGVTATGGVYAVCALDREDPNVLSDAPLGPATLVWMGRPLEQTAPLTTATVQNIVTRRVQQFIGGVTSSIVYKALWVAWHWVGNPLGPWWQYVPDYPNCPTVIAWEGTPSSTGVAVASGAQAFPLRDVLNGSIRDFYGNATCAGGIVDWYVDAERRLILVVHVHWDYHYIGAAAGGYGSVTWPVGIRDNAAGHQETYTRTEQVYAPPSTGVLGAKKQSDKQTVPESHVFLVQADTGAVVWATAGPSVAFGVNAMGYASGMLEHYRYSDPGYNETELPAPNRGSVKAPVEIEWYSTASSAWSLTEREEWTEAEAEIRVRLVSSTGTHQLFDPTRLAAIEGPYEDEPTDESTGVATLVTGNARWHVTLRTKTGSVARRWHYRVAGVQVFSARVLLGAGEEARAVDAPRLFLVLERYPYLPGTNYIADTPQTWVGVVDADGTVVRVLRGWQPGLNAGVTERVTGNGHRLVWTLGTGAAVPIQTVLVTDLDTGAERVVTPADWAAWWERSAKLYPPDFLWDRQAPEAFLQPAALPALTEDAALAELAGLVPLAQRLEGSVRIVNDQDTLAPLDRYRET